jgi:release factor glutamine methyltransferase
MTPTTPDLNVLELLRAAKDPLAARGCDAPRFDAELLLSRALGCDRLGLYVDHDRPVSDSERALYRELLERRGTGEPVAYILGEREFFGLMFHVDRRCLVPRPETEHLVDEAVALLSGQDRPRVADVGTGSGCIAVSLAHQFGGARLFAVDAQADALDVARANAARLVPDADVTFLCGDLCAPLREHAPFDLIASNPPYITTDEMAELPKDVRDFEPVSALEAGEDGIAFHLRLVEEGLPLLSAGGALVMEVGEGGADRLRKLMDVRSVADLAGIPRVVVVTP